MSSPDITIDFNAIASNHYNEIFHYIRKQTNNIEDSKDLTQEVFMKVYQKLHTYNPDKASIRTWIYRIAHNHVINHFKTLYRKKTVNLDDFSISRLSDEDDLLESLIQNDNVDLILKLMESILNKKHYSIVSLYFFSNLTVKEISDSLKIPIKTIYNSINVSLKKIKKEMEVTING